MRVKECMSPSPVTIEPWTTVLNARRLMGRYGIRHLPVVTDRDRLVGIVHSVDVLPGEHQVITPVSPLEWDLLIGRYRAVETIMRKPVAVVDPEEDLAGAAQTMLCERVDAVPVVRAGLVVGLLSASDCLRGLLESAARQRGAARDVEVDPDEDKVVPLESFA